MKQQIAFLETIANDLLCLSGLCNVLGCAWEGPSQPLPEDISNSYSALRDILQVKAEAINKVVMEHHEARAGEPAAKP